MTWTDDYYLGSSDYPRTGEDARPYETSENPDDPGLDRAEAVE